MEVVSGKTELPRLLTGVLDLDSLPDRLDDIMMEAVNEIACSPLPDLPTCDSKTFGQVLRMMLAALPRRQADDISGELFVAAYERQLGHINRPQAEFLLDKALQTCKWFPTIAECLEILEGWRRNDDATKRQSRAKYLIARENNQRRAFNWPPEREIPQITQADVDVMGADMIRLGIKCGALVEGADGKVTVAPE